MVTLRRVGHVLRPWVGVLALGAVFALFSILYPETYPTKTNILSNILGQVTFLAIMASVQTVVMVIGEFDLSVGGMAALAAGAAATIINTQTIDGQPKQPGSLLWAVALCLIVGVLCGAVNGLLVSYAGILAFVATLAMNEAYQNLAAFRVKGKPVYSLVRNNFVAPGQGSIWGIPNRLFVALAAALAVWILLDHTPLGRRMYAVGGNADAARNRGINVRRVKWIAFVVCGLGAAVTGLTQSAYLGTANLTAPAPLMLQSIAAVFMGMAFFRDGRPNLPGTMIGVVLFRVLETGLNQTSIDDYLQSVITWLVVIVIVLPTAITRLRTRR
jgi:ribose transport system permease protein